MSSLGIKCVLMRNLPTSEEIKYLFNKMCCSQNHDNCDLRITLSWFWEQHIGVWLSALSSTGWYNSDLLYTLDMDSGELFIYLISILTVWEIIVVSYRPWNELNKIINVKNLSAWLSLSSTWWMIAVTVMTLSQSLLPLWQVPQLSAPTSTLRQNYS